MANRGFVHHHRVHLLETEEGPEMHWRLGPSGSDAAQGNWASAEAVAALAWTCVICNNPLASGEFHVGPSKISSAAMEIHGVMR